MTLPPGSFAPAARWLSAAAPLPNAWGSPTTGPPPTTPCVLVPAGEVLLYAGASATPTTPRGARAAPHPRPAAQLPPAEAFRRERHRRREAHLLLNRLVVPWVRLAHPATPGPDVTDALTEALGPAPGEPGLLPLREVQGAVGATSGAGRGSRSRAWERASTRTTGSSRRSAGVRGAGRGRALHPRPARQAVFDLGTGSGVLALPARAGAPRVVASDAAPRAVACAPGERRAGSATRPQVEVLEADLFPEGRADLVLCNPPWVPADAHTPLERAVYNPGGRFLSRFLEGLPLHLAPGGEAFLVLSDLAERLGLRAPGALEASFAAAGLLRVDARSAPAAHPGPATRTTRSTRRAWAR